MDKKSATKTLIFYFKTLFEKAGIPWTSDNSAEIEDVVEGIVKDAARYTEERVNGLAEEHNLI